MKTVQGVLGVEGNPLPLHKAEVSARVQQPMPWSRNLQRGEGNGSLTEPFVLAQLVGEDPAFMAVKRKIPLLARCEAPVLLTGETGTGKEMCARALHYVSRRAGKPFLPVNCGAIPVELFESELFGHQKGAFTSAWTAQSGFIAEAEGGTLFLDEIETLSLGVQVKLLRFLQDQTYHTLGSPKPRQANDGSSGRGANACAGTSNGPCLCCAPKASSSKPTGRGCRSITGSIFGNGRRLPRSSKVRRDRRKIVRPLGDNTGSLKMRKQVLLVMCFVMVPVLADSMS